jgi:hypothetical protein
VFITGIADFGAFTPRKTTWLGLGPRVFLETCYVPSGNSRQLKIIGSSYFLGLGLKVSEIISYH